MKKIKAEITLTLPPTYISHNLSFTINLSDNNAMLLEGDGLLMLETMESYWASLRFNTSALNSDKDSKLVFSSIGLLEQLR